VAPSQTYKFIWQALRHREAIAFLYGGKARTACPIVLGYSADGREALSAFQVAGETSGGRPLPAWRCFDLTEMHGLKTTAAEWREGASHKRPQTCVRFVDVDVNVTDTLTRPEPLPFGSPQLRAPRRSKAPGR
jgi:hypothetical protein